MIRSAEPQDACAIERFLARHAETSMFLRGNLAAHGTDEPEHRHGTTFFLEEQDGDICAVGGVTNGGFLMSQSDSMQRFHAAFAAELAGRSLHGMTGAAAEVSAMFDALSCHHAEFSLREVAPLYALDLRDLDAEEYPGGMLRLPVATDAAFLSEWFDGFRADTGLMPLGGGDARDTTDHFVRNADARVLVKDDQPVAMTTFNARTADTVQIGGVYVPPQMRGSGYGGGIVARHLIEARAQGIEKAILFAANAPAARAYEAIGFKHVGAYEIALFQEPLEVPL